MVRLTTLATPYSSRSTRSRWPKKPLVPSLPLEMKPIVLPSSVSRRGASLPAGGRMVAVFADPEYVEHAAAGFPRVSVAAYNGQNTVLSGPGEDLETIVTACAAPSA